MYLEKLLHIPVAWGVGQLLDHGLKNRSNRQNPVCWILQLQLNCNLKVAIKYQVKG